MRNKDPETRDSTTASKAMAALEAWPVPRMQPCATWYLRALILKWGDDNQEKPTGVYEGTH